MVDFERSRECTHRATVQQWRQNEKLENIPLLLCTTSNKAMDASKDEERGNSVYHNTEKL